MMTTDEIYEFDIKGYIVYSNVLSQETLKRINTILADVKGTLGDGKFSFFMRDPYFIELMALPRTIEI
jgi:hypothetical protein